MASPVQISINQLARLIGTPAAPVIVDVRNDEDYTDDARIVPSAIRFAYPAVTDNIETLAKRIGSDRAIVYCQKGLKLSEGVASLLRTEGVKAEVLEGGQFGWRDASMPMLNDAREHLLKTNADGHSMWVTRVRPKVDRVACAWFVRRFIDPDAIFLFVTRSQVALVAEKFNATPFDVEDVLFSHRDACCTFDTMLHEFGLLEFGSSGTCQVSSALARLALIVRGADTDQLELAPQCAGLLAMSLGLSRLHNNDLEQLELGMAFYDAMYRWARDAFGEKHDWSSAGHVVNKT